MKWTSWAFLAFIGSLCFFVLFIADQQMNAGVDALSTIKILFAGPVIEARV